MKSRLFSAIIAALFCFILTDWLVSHKTIAKTQNDNSLKELSQVAAGKQFLLGVFYTDDYPKNMPAINGAFWFYDFATGKQERIITFPRSTSGMHYKLKNNQILFETGGDLNILGLANKKLKHISDGVPADQFVFSPDGSIVYYLTCEPFSFACKSWGLHQYSIDTGVKEELKSDFAVDTLLGSDSLGKLIYFAKDNYIYALQKGRIKLIYELDKSNASESWYNFTLSPDGSIVLITKEAHRAGKVMGAILDIAQKKYHILNSQFPHLHYASFTDDSKSICGFFGDRFITVDLQTFNFSERSITVKNGFPVSWSPDQSAFVARNQGFENRRGFVTFTLQPAPCPECSFSIESEVANGNTPNFHFIGWFGR